MRYFTKKWYNDTVVAAMCFQLRRTEKAAKHSDKFYEKLYALEEKAYIRYRKRELKMLKQSKSLDEMKEEFRKNTVANLEFVKTNLPEDILSEIADIRILGLGSVTNDMHAKITRYCGKINRQCESVERQYEIASDEAFELIDGKTTKALGALIGSEIISISKDCDNTAIEFLNDDNNTKYVVTLTNVQETDEDKFAEGVFVVKYEIITTEDKKFEFALLCIDEDLQTYTYSYTADNISADKK